MNTFTQTKNFYNITRMMKVQTDTSVKNNVSLVSSLVTNEHLPKTKKSITL